MTTDDDWTPAFDGQRPPWGPRNLAAVTSGARSERQMGPLAVEIERAARADPAWPDYLDDPSYDAAVTAWARAEAMAELVWQYLADRDIAAALTALEETDEQSEMAGRNGRRITSTRRTTAALDAFHRAQSAAAGHRRSLGLDPLARARLGRDVVATEAMARAGLDRLTVVGSELVEAARTRGALNAPQVAPDDEKEVVTADTPDGGQVDGQDGEEHGER